MSINYLINKFRESENHDRNLKIVRGPKLSTGPLRYVKTGKLQVINKFRESENHDRNLKIVRGPKLSTGPLRYVKTGKLQDP